ncbi:MAG: 2-C-methyl-D-erythritol 4-phosphate cytidylyltransferase [Armatimonadota bacterium]|jgi:2-C-methyl-D-erythritol 4-phosphate cytidylyltransferase/2-C-methyl-D-erythritol 2,4-cyclodiphosphate synthase
MRPRTAALIAAAGRGERLGSPDNKAFVLLNEKPLAWYALDAIRAAGGIEEIVLVVAPADVERARRCFLSADSGEGCDAVTLKVTAGGEQRQESIRAGLTEVNPECDLVLVHDAARPLVRPALIRQCIEAAGRHGAVIAAVPATDTVKEVGAEGAVAATLDRSRVWLVQTPQVFRYGWLMEAHEKAADSGFAGTDDAALVEHLGHRVHVVLGDIDNIKVTWNEDLRRAERYLLYEGRSGVNEDMLQSGDIRAGEARLSQRQQTREREAAYRSGIGYDAHPFGTGRPLVLGGVVFARETGLDGHSDADVVCHAICDALLGAAAAGDIGGRFPDTDPQYAGISSLALLSRSAQIVRSAGWNIENVDAVVIAEAPKIAPRVAEMRRALAGAMGVTAEQVSVKGKTTEGMGFAGRREGIASEAIVLLKGRGAASEL